MTSENGDVNGVSGEMGHQLVADTDRVASFAVALLESLPEEPASLRDAQRGNALLEPVSLDGALTETSGKFAGWLWASWEPQLQSAGIAQDDLPLLLGGYRREIWLWLMGDRRWQQMAAGLAGRASRRTRMSA